MSANEESMELDGAEPIDPVVPIEPVASVSFKDKILDGFLNIFRVIARIVTEGNTLSISAEQAALAQPESYAKVRGRIKMGTLVGYEYVVMNLLATVIVCCGLATNSMLAIFGASAIAMLLEPIMGASLAIVEGDRKLFIQALYAVMMGALLVLGASFVFAMFYRHHITNLPDSSLIRYASPNLLDLVMAIACGAGCAYATLSRKIRVGLGGVVLSITLMPPLAACGIFLSHGRLSLAAGALLAYFANFIAIQFTASVVFWLHGFKSDIESDLNVVKIFKKNVVGVILIMTLAVVLSFNLKHVLERQRFEQDVKVSIRKSLHQIAGTDLANIYISRKNEITVIVRSLHEISRDQVVHMAAKLPMVAGKHPELHMRIVKAQEISIVG